ncbi:Asp-tRNA(Asn)/Glu-tRNA(Gln) amidotransferase subunit GatC, partial [Oleiphilus sp. HI0086]
NTEDIPPMAHPMDAVQVLRPDVVTESDKREKLQTVAPNTEDGLFLVPKVIE